MSYIDKREPGFGRLLPYLALFLTWGLVHTSLVVFRDIPVFETGLLGPDSYMRMYRVTELLQSWNWFDSSVARANAPYGDVLHWTRPFDLLLIVVALPLSFGFGWEQALYVSGIVISPLLQLSTGLLLIWALRPVIRPEVWFLPVIALFLQPGALAYSVLGRADHHGLLLLVFVVTAGFLLRALSNPLDSRPALLAGIAVGFGTWLSVEFLMVMGLCLAALGLPWLFGERERAGQSKWFVLAICCVLLLALLTERPIARFLEPSYDRVSSVQFLVTVIILLFWRTVETFETRGGHTSRFIGRATLALLGSGGAGLLVNAIYPLFFAGLMVEVDPRILPIWLDRVLEMRPLLPYDQQTLGIFIFYLGGVTLVTPLFLKTLLEERFTKRFFPYLFIAIACLLLTLVALQHMRFSGYAEIGFVMAFAVVLDRYLRWTERIHSDLTRGLLRGGFVGLMLLGPIMVGATMMAKDADATGAAGQSLEGCQVNEVASYLETDPRWSAEPQTILAFMDIGPELLYRTRHSVIGTPYHRNGDGIYDGYRMLATDDNTAALALVTQRRVDLVLLCRTPAERSFYADRTGRSTLYQRLAQGSPPSWLRAVELPAALRGQADLYRVIR
ncbi:MAG: hypothetical protein RH942_19440 [Kiloniellaceae bacterium]